MEKKQDWEELFGKYISKNVKDVIIYDDRVDMYIKAKRLLEDEQLRKQCVSELNNAIEKKGRWKQRFEMLEKFLSVKLIGLNNKIPSYIIVKEQKCSIEQKKQLYDINIKKGNKMIKSRTKITRFFESILCIKNEGMHKVIGIFGIKIKVKNKHKELLNFFVGLKQNIDTLKQQQMQQMQQMQQQIQQQSLLLQQLLFYIEKENKDKK